MKRVAALLLMILLVVGCRKAATDTPAVPNLEKVPASPQATELPQADALGQREPAYAFTFSATTLEGDTVTESVLGLYDLTMVNLWASWCPPCVGELKELEQLYERLPENVGFLSITVDAARDLDDARALLKENGCAFPCLIGESSKELETALWGKAQYIPTTIFLDSTGQVVGEWIVGVPQSNGSVADAYMAEINARLDGIQGK